MAPTNDRTVQGFPLSLLWRDGKDVASRRLRNLVRDEADVLIQDRAADVVIAQVGAPLLWLPPESIEFFWKRTPKSAFYHTTTFHGQVLNKSISPSFLLYPSEWEPIGDSPLVLLESICWPYDSSLKMF